MSDKLCVSCNKVKPLSEFYKTSSGGFRKQCKVCLNEKKKQRYKQEKLEKQNKEQISKDETNIGDIKNVNAEIPTDTEMKQNLNETKEDINLNKEFNSKMMSFGVETSLSMIFSVIGSRVGEHWYLTKDELNILTESISTVLNKLTYAKEIGQNMDYINLGLAIITVFVPKVEKTIKTKIKGGKQVEKIPRPATKSNENISNFDRKNKRTNTDKPDTKNQVETTSRKYSKDDIELQQLNETILNDII